MVIYMNTSILADVRTACNVNEYDTAFDTQLIPLINTFLFRLAQVGIGTKGFSVTGIDQKWNDFIPENSEYFHSVKTYVSIRVRLEFDPPDNSSVSAALQADAKELEWCLYNEAEFGLTDM